MDCGPRLEEYFISLSCEGSVPCFFFTQSFLTEISNDFVADSFMNGCVHF